LRVAQTLVGFVTNRPEGFPVGGVDPPADAEVVGVADDGLGAQGSVFLEVLLEPAGPVVADDLRVHSFGDDLGAEASGSLDSDPPVEDERDRWRAADVEVVADDALEEGPAGGGPVEHPGVGDLELPKRQVVDVAGA
jgi:hypothetical protein